MSPYRTRSPSGSGSEEAGILGEYDLRCSRCSCGWAEFNLLLLKLETLVRGPVSVACCVILSISLDGGTG